MISSLASCSAFDSATSGESKASRREAARATRLVGGMMRNWSSVDKEIRGRGWKELPETRIMRDGWKARLFLRRRAAEVHDSIVGRIWIRGVEKSVGDRGPITKTPAKQPLFRFGVQWILNNRKKN
jgi:hypothetical protein